MSTLLTLTSPLLSSLLLSLLSSPLCFSPFLTSLLCSSPLLTSPLLPSLLSSSQGHEVQDGKSMGCYDVSVAVSPACQAPVVGAASLRQRAGHSDSLWEHGTTHIYTSSSCPSRGGQGLAPGWGVVGGGGWECSSALRMLLSSSIKYLALVTIPPHRTQRLSHLESYIYSHITSITSRSYIYSALYICHI